MHEQDQGRSRWDDLARELGLEATPETERSVPQPVPPPRRPPVEHVPASRAFVEEEPAFSRPGSAREEFAVEPPAPEGLFPEDPAPPREQPAGREGPDDRPRRGRRGRRSGKGGRGPDESPRAERPERPTADLPPGVDRGAAPVDPEGEQPRRRGRGRGRPRSREEEVHQAEEAAAVPEPLPEPDADDSDVSDLSNWTVPSWQELIGSLYRPER